MDTRAGSTSVALSVGRVETFDRMCKECPVPGQQDSADSIRRRLLAADSLLRSSLIGMHQISAYATDTHHSLIEKLNNGFFESALDELVNAGQRYEPDGKALPAEFWSNVAAAASDLGLDDRAIDLQARAG